MLLLQQAETEMMPLIIPTPINYCSRQTETEMMPSASARPPRARGSRSQP
jgi:hypothetical protein